MSLLFIADIHLCQHKPIITAAFVHFLSTRALTAQAVYILGDLFETWIGDDDPNPLHQEIILALNLLNQHGIPCYFIHGNRDFLLGERYAAACTMQILSETQVIQCYGQRVIILHGDILCTHDKNYHYFRYLIRKNWLQYLFLCLPLCLRLNIANIIRTYSKLNSKNKITNIIDINKNKVMELMIYNHASIMIHGHTHLPAIHIMKHGKCRIVLGAWSQQGSIIEVNKQGITLFDFPFTTSLHRI